MASKDLDQVVVRMSADLTTAQRDLAELFAESGLIVVQMSADLTTAPKDLAELFAEGGLKAADRLLAIGDRAARRRAWRMEVRTAEIAAAALAKEHAMRPRRRENLLNSFRLALNAKLGASEGLFEVKTRQ